MVPTITVRRVKPFSYLNYKYWRHVPQSYGLKLDDVNAVLKALVAAITRRPFQYLEGGFGVNYSIIFGTIGGTIVMKKLNRWI
ncbi:hypothetical protein Y032_0253g258 [Ancylostoma ceylanicum]|nr:hypothetical protein Y032_0253g258 [Ancylostoma ceylanicum]